MELAHPGKESEILRGGSNSFSHSFDRYCAEWMELISLFSALSQSPSILSICQHPFHLSVVNPNPADPVTKTGNIVENGVWQYALRETPYSNGTRLSSADEFHKSILNGVDFIYVL